jgi:hypothetical protein
MIQCCSQVIRVPVHSVFIKPKAQLVLRFEALITTFEDSRTSAESTSYVS